MFPCSDEYLISRLKEFIKEQLVSIPPPSRPAAPPAQPSPAASLTDPGAMLAGLL